MCDRGRVIAQSGLNFRETPGGAKISLLPFGTVVDVRGETGDWLEISVEGRVGYVFARYLERVRQVQVAPGAGFRFEGRDAIAPDGTVFARKFRRGVFNVGRTTISTFLDDYSEAFRSLSPSLVNVMLAVSENEGNLEAINTWDNAFLTFGVFQWTAGTRNGKGELAALLARLKVDDAEAFDRHFGSHGLDVTELSGDPPRGRFVLRGVVLSEPSQKERLRTLEYAYLFWRAGHDFAVRRSEIAHAMARIESFYRHPAKRIRDRFVADYVSSEYGVALLLDQHVNRPGHVPRTLSRAVDQFISEGGADDPATWGFAEEQHLLKLYLTFRHQTSMTDSRKRAQTTFEAVVEGRASDQRGSFGLA